MRLQALPIVAEETDDDDDESPACRAARACRNAAAVPKARRRDGGETNTTTHHPKTWKCRRLLISPCLFPNGMRMLYLVRNRLHRGNKSKSHVYATREPVLIDGRSAHLSVTEQSSVMGLYFPTGEVLNGMPRREAKHKKGVSDMWLCFVAKTKTPNRRCCCQQHSDKNANNGNGRSALTPVSVIIILSLTVREGYSVVDAPGKSSNRRFLIFARRARSELSVSGAALRMDIPSMNAMLTSLTACTAPYD